MKPPGLFLVATWMPADSMHRTEDKMQLQSIASSVQKNILP